MTDPPRPATPGPPDPTEGRARSPRVWISGIGAIVLTIGAGFVFAVGYGFFGVVLAVLAVFAAVDLTWALRRGSTPQARG